MIPTQPKSQNIPSVQSNPRHPSPSSRSRVPRFPMEKLVPKPLLPEQLPYQPPTPPPEEGDEDTTMDWTPQHNFRPAKEYNTLQAQPAFHEPSPFHGALPPAPVSWAQRLRNPTQPAFHRASDEKKEKFFSRRTKNMFPDSASDVSGQLSPKSPSFMSGISSPVKFAPPRFFAPADRMETGLEALFEDTFTLSQDTKSSNNQTAQHHVEVESSSLGTSPVTRLVTTILLSMSCVVWDFATIFFPASVPAARSICQLLAAIVSSLNAASSAALPPTTRSIGSALFYGVEATAAATLSGLVWEPWGYSMQSNICALGLWFLIGLTVQEVWDFFSSLLLPAAATAGQKSGNMEPTEQHKVIHKPATQQQTTTRSEAGQRPFNQAPKANKATALSTTTALNSMQMSQRTTRSKARDEVRRDSLGVNDLGSLSLGGW